VGRGEAGMKFADDVVDLVFDGLRGDDFGVVAEA
jgi:hypothetical protein